MEQKNKLGIEIELLVLDKQFKESSKADILIKKARMEEIHLEPECSNNMVELISKPGTSNEIIKEVTRDFQKLNNIANQLNLQVIPIDYPLNETFIPQIRERKKFAVQKEILGERFIHTGSVCGTHIHFDLNETSKDEQINLLKILDPLIIAITATTKKNYGDFFIQNWRLYAYRNITYKNFPENGGFTALTKDYSSFLIQTENLTEKFNNSYTGTENIKEIILPLRGVWGSLRPKEEIKTIELRSPGAIPDFIFLKKLLEFVEKINESIIQGKITLKNVLTNVFQTTNINVASERLKEIHDSVILHGINSQIYENFKEKLLKSFQNEEFKEQYNELVKLKKKRENIITKENKSNEQKYKELLQLSLQTAKNIASEEFNIQEKIEEKNETNVVVE